MNIAELTSKARNQNILKQIGASFAFKVLSILLNLWLVPIVLNYLGIELYGVWVTILSFLSWLSLSDVGIGQGLRNKLATALADDDKREALAYVSTAYGTIFIISMALLIFTTAAVWLLDWQAVLNTGAVQNSTIQKALTITLIGVFINFSLGLVNQVINALQKNSWASVVPILSNLILVAFLLLYPVKAGDQLINYSVFYVIGSFISLITFSLFVYHKYPYLIPTIKSFDRLKIYDITKLGINFFIIQIAVIVIFNTGNIIIAQLFSAEEVTPYSVLYRLFNFLTIFFGMILTPFWSAYTEAYAKRDFEWMRKSIMQLNQLMIPTLVVVTLIGFFAEKIILLWTKEVFQYDFLLISLMSLYAIIAIWNNIYSFFLNGIGRTKEQLVTAAIGAVINIPLSIFFAKYLQLGSAGVMLSMIICLGLFSVVGPIATFNEISNGQQSTAG
jgi:O-antigen/teichoic acid export membrane protein